MNFYYALYAALGGSVLAMGFALFKTRWIYRQKVESLELAKIACFVQEGAMAFLSREYRTLVPYVAIVAVFLALPGGTVMGMSVVGLSLLGIFIVLLVFIRLAGSGVPELKTPVFPLLSGFSLGASSIALFSRVGGGIFTKAADAGADPVGKVEAGIPEDDPRNPATIADNVGDNVGDVAGMGADLFESFVGSIVGAMILGLSVSASDDLRIKPAAVSLLLAVTGLGVGMMSAFPVVILIGSAMVLSNLPAGLYGIAISAVGMLVTLGIQLAVDAYGPIADNAGGAWDNAKKMIESGNLGGKASEAHKAAVVEDTVGDPFKDTAGPSLNILIKLKSVVSLVIAPMLKTFHGL